MTVFDYAVLVILGLSSLLSVIRGLVREVLALLAWVVAFVAANLFSGQLAALLPEEIPGTELRTIAGFAGVFLAVLLLMSLLAVAVSHLVKNAGLAVEDRVFGAAFGFVRGLLVVLALVLLAGLTSLPKEKAWREAAFAAPLQAVAVQVSQWLPAELSKRIRYD